MHDIFPSVAPPARPLSDFHLKRMVLSPTHWKACNLSCQLTWRPVQFGENTRQSVPDDKTGVYSFVVKPGIADHHDLAYLLYVGKVERQTFRDRYSQYLADFRKGDESRRPHVAEMLRRWEGFLWFYYAPIDTSNEINTVEETLLSAYLPPCNHDFPATVAKQLKKLWPI